jgi:hypothetical protein
MELALRSASFLMMTLAGPPNHRRPSAVPIGIPRARHLPADALVGRFFDGRHGGSHGLRL